MNGKDSIRIQYQTADGIKMYARVSRAVLRYGLIYRACMKILRIDGKERDMDHTEITPKRKYVLWTQLKNGTYVFREDL